jgi:hypothetical protein
MSVDANEARHGAQPCSAVCTGQVWFQEFASRCSERHKRYAAESGRTPDKASRCQEPLDKGSTVIDQIYGRFLLLERQR